MKKILSITLAILLLCSLFALSGCSGDTSPSTPTSATYDEASSSSTPDEATQDEVTFDFVTSTELYINWTTKSGIPLTGVVGIDYNEDYKNISLSMLNEDEDKLWEISAGDEKIRLEIIGQNTGLKFATEVYYE